MNPIVYLIGASLLGVGSILGKILSFPVTLRQAISSARKVVARTEEIDKAVERIISGGGEVTPFIDWVGDVVARIVVKVPAAFEADKPLVWDLVSEIFSTLPTWKAHELIPSAPESAVNGKLSRLSLARRALASPEIQEAVKEKVNGHVS
jgi:hypothetical protein